MAVDYGAGRENLGSLYTNLRTALANKGAAENLQAQRDIDNRGLFGTGIRSSDVTDLGDLAIRGAEFGQGRMDRQMANAEKSFGRRQAADERRLKTLQKRADKGGLDEDGYREMDAIQMGMVERRNAFEDKMAEYSGKGIWGTGFGSEEVGWRTSDKGAVSPESIYSRKMRGTSGGDDSGEASSAGYAPSLEDNLSRQTGRGPRPTYYPSIEDQTMMEESTKNFPGRPSREDFNTSPRQSAPGGRSEWEDKHGMGTAPPMGLSGARDPRGARRGRTGGGAEYRTPEAFQMDDIAPRSNKFSEGIMNTRRSGPVEDNAPFETFSDAFANARREKGPGAVFDWRGKPYTTDYK